MHAYIHIYQSALTASRHVDTRSAEKKYRIIFMFGLLYEYSSLEYERIYVMFRVTQAEYDTRILMAASQECVNTYSTPRTATH